MNRASRYWTELQELKKAVARVRNLHHRYEGEDGSTWCKECGGLKGLTNPCPTIQALEGK